MEDAESLAQSAAERLSEDEALRGDLTDEGFGPLLNWAIEATLAYARNLQSDKLEEAMDAYASRLKNVVQEVVAAADAGKIEDATPLLDFEMAQPDPTREKLANLKFEAASPDANAVQITQVLSEALAAPPVQQTEAASSTPPAEVAPASDNAAATANTPGTAEPTAKPPAPETAKATEEAGLESVSAANAASESSTAALGGSLGDIVGKMFKQATSKTRITISKGVKRTKKLKRPSFRNTNSKNAK